MNCSNREVMEILSVFYIPDLKTNILRLKTTLEGGFLTIHDKL